MEKPISSVCTKSENLFAEDVDFASYYDFGKFRQYSIFCISFITRKLIYK